MTRHPPNSTLSPYTTLFPSRGRPHPAGPRRDGFRETEVDHLHFHLRARFARLQRAATAVAVALWATLPAREHDVARLEIAMHEAALGCRDQRLRDLHANFNRQSNAEGPVAPHPRFEGFAFHQLHRAVAAIAIGGGAELKHARDVRMP